MGTKQSRPSIRSVSSNCSCSSLASGALQDIPKDKVVKYVESLGTRDGGSNDNEYDFRLYAKLVDDNGIDGDLLSEMDETAFLETLDDIDVTDAKHRDILLQEFRKYFGFDHNDETDDDDDDDSSDDDDDSDSDDDDDSSGNTDTAEAVKKNPAITVIECASSTPQVPRPPPPSKPPHQYHQPNKPEKEHLRHLPPNFYQAVDSVTVPSPPEPEEDDDDDDDSDESESDSDDDDDDSSSTPRPSSPTKHHPPSTAISAKSETSSQPNHSHHRPPISLNDMDRVAQLETYKLEEIQPGSPIATKLESLVQMAMNLFDPLCDMGDITWLNHQYQYSIARVYSNPNNSNSSGAADTPSSKTTVEDSYEVVNYHPKTGKPFLCRTDRSIGICNYPTYTGKTLVLHDIMQDPAFSWLRHVWPHRCYIGAPLLTASGVVIGTLCLHNLEPLASKDDFDRQCEMQLEQVANMIMQSVENWKLRRNISVLETTRITLTQSASGNKSKPPEGTNTKAVICFVGVEEYETLMDVAPKPMRTALKIYHDQIVQLCTKYQGYKVDKAGPYFNNHKHRSNNRDGHGDDGESRYCLIFHDAVDAFGFSLQLQQSLFDADWTIDVLALPRVGDNGQGFRGLRVKCSIFMGPINKAVNQQQNILEYQSREGNQNTIGIANTLYDMCYGGQILTIFDTWNVASFLADSKLESPQVVDLGEHIIQTGLKVSDGVLQQRIIQLVPAPLAIDYGEVKGVTTTTTNKQQLLQDYSFDNESLDPGNNVDGEAASLAVASAPPTTTRRGSMVRRTNSGRVPPGGLDQSINRSTTDGRSRRRASRGGGGEMPSYMDQSHHSMDMSVADDLAICVMNGGLWGRQFPEIDSEKKVSPSFFDAPGFNDDTGLPTVTIAFIGTGEIEKRYKEDATEIVSRIIGLASSTLDGTRGYQCQNNMLAFPNITSAINFGLKFSLQLQQEQHGEVSMGSLVTYGCVHDSFITLEPHKTTGRADYFGKVVNRAARVAYTSALGTVSAGVVVTPEFDPNSFTVADDPTITTRFVDRRRLKGVDGEVAVYECERTEGFRRN